MMNFWQIQDFQTKKSVGAPIAPTSLVPLIMLLLLYISTYVRVAQFAKVHLVFKFRTVLKS